MHGAMPVVQGLRQAAAEIDGMAAAQGCVFISTKTNQVICLGASE